MCPRLNNTVTARDVVESRSRDVLRLNFQSFGPGLGLEALSLGLGLGLESQVSSFSLSLELFSLDYIEVINQANPLTSPVSVSAVTAASQTSDVRAWELARDIMHPLLDKIFCAPASSTPVEHVFSHGGVIMRPHRVRLGDQMLSALVYLNCNEHVAVYNMTLKSSNVKQ